MAFLRLGASDAVSKEMCMIIGRVGAIAVTALALVASDARSAPPVDWDGLQRVQAKRFELVYVQPGADFRGYSKVILEPTEVAFHKDWRRNHNSTSRGLAGRVSEQDVQRAIARGIDSASGIFADAWKEGGFTVVQAPGPDVLRVRTGIMNISVTSPDVRSAARSYSFSNEAGQASLVIELHDSMTGALLGRVVDRKLAGDDITGWRTSVTNRSDFRDLVQRWAKESVRGMGELKRLSPGH